MIANRFSARRALAVSILCLLAVGCESTKKKTASAVNKKGAAKASPSTGPSLTLPATLFMYAGSTKPADTLGALTAIANKVQPGLPNPAMMIPAMLQQNFRLTSAGGMDIKKSIAIALFDPTIYGRDPSATVIGITSKAQFEASLPKTEQKQNNQGNAYSYTKWKGAKYPVFVNFTQHHAVLTRHKDMFPKYKSFLESLAKHDFPEQGSAYVSIKNGMLGHGELVKKTIERAKAKIESVIAQSPSPKSGQMVTGAFGSAIRFANDMDGVEAVLGLKPAGIKVDIRLHPKAGTPLAKIWAKLEGGEHDIIKLAAPDSVAFASLAFKKTEGIKMLSTLFRSVFTTMATADIMSPEMKTSIEKTLGELEKSMGNSALVFAHNYPTTQGLSPTLAFKVKDGKAVQNAFAEIGTLMTKDEKAAARYAELGIKVDYQADAYKIGGRTVAVQKTTVLKPNPAMALMADLLEQHVTVTDTIGIVAYGGSAKAEIKAMTEKQYNGLDKKPGVDYLLKNGAISPLLHVYISPIEVMQRIKLGGMNPFAVSLAGIKATSGLGISAGKYQSGMQIVINVPTDLLKDGMNAFMKIKGGF
jgi:hypothetical protein